MEWIDAALKLSQVGSTALLALAVMGFVRGWVVARWSYERLEKERDSWQTLYEREKATTDKRLASFEDDRRREKERP